MGIFIIVKMMKTFLFGALTLQSISAAAANNTSTNTTAPEVTVSDHDRACQIYGDGDFTHFNLTTLAKTGDNDYLKDGIEFKVCDYLPRSTYFARSISMT